MAEPEQTDSEVFDHAFAGLIELLKTEYEAGYFSIYRLFPVASLVLGDRAQVGNASQFIYHFARSQGYNLPPYPLAGSGEIKKFFADESVKNVPEWYEKIGLTADEYAHIHEYTIISVRGRHADRRALLLRLYMRNWPQFVPLAESGIASLLTGKDLARLLDEVIACSLDDTETKSPNPTIRIERFPLIKPRNV